MRPPTSPIASLPDIALDCTDEELFISLEKMADGYPPPGNVITDVNPYNYEPSNLPDGIWYFIPSKENGPIELGFWRVKGEACKLFSSSAITGWRTTLEFFEGQVPHEQKTDWIMQDYWITRKGPDENSKVKEGSSLCKVFHGGEQGLDHNNRQKMASLHVPHDSTQSIVLKTLNDTSKPVANKDGETGNLAVTGEPPSALVEMENPAEIDYFSRGDYLELRDLDTPASRSSTSDNSSCFTMSSDECFDSLALLEEIEAKINQDSVQKNESCKLSISAPSKPDEVVWAPASPGSLIGIEESKPHTGEILATESSPPTLANDHKDQDNIVLQHSIRNQKANYSDEGSSSSNDVGTSSDHRLPFQDAERKVDESRLKKLKKKKKYLCFMPLHFLF
ncbi:NAC domain-containing protein 2 isoform X2 [Jatropha curcas]|uniref:NAC transcription factor 097 n=1 Tax=Jatropha curcas TaxID=180498 RepID=R4N7U0_JATCU|nr:NAC domain-containing protein 2 isoform X2 [Jatropha curcas]AGL39753.1 NAC transcription factor 097 [Jatropha curcas]